MWSVDLKCSGSTIDVGIPKQRRPIPPNVNSADMTADGKRFLLSMLPAMQASDSGSKPPLVAVFNWTAALKTVR